AHARRCAQLRRAARPGAAAHGGGDCRSRAPGGEAHDPAALHPALDARADAALHRHVARPESVRRHLRRAHRGDRRPRRRGARRAQAGGRAHGRRRGVSGVAESHRAPRIARAGIERILRDAEKRSAALFAQTPKAPVVARPYPPFRWASAAASYSFPAPDGSRPGTFQIPLRPSQLTRFGLRSLVYHETVPGHHFQIALEMENPALPRFRQLRAYGFISAYGEGWALYAERLAAEALWYEDDPEGLLGQLAAELFRARRLVVDTGLHAKRWTREQAIAYGIGPSEVERYVVFPGQACSYKLGAAEQQPLE